MTITVKGAPTSSSGTLTWSPPTLVNPVTINITNTSTGRKAIMDPTKDYIVKMPSTPLTVQDGLEINGGRNVVLIGGEINLAQNYGTTNGNRAVFIKGNSAQTGPRTLFIEGLKIAGYLTEGFDVDSQSEPGLTVILQNISNTDILRGSQSTNHSDFFQCYNGPTNIYMDRIYCRPQYQTWMLQPKQFGTVAPKQAIFKNVLVDATTDSGVTGYMVTGTSAADRYAITTENVKVRYNPTKSWPSGLFLEQTSFWGSGYSQASPSDTSPCTGNPGTGYVSPGYGTTAAGWQLIVDEDFTTNCAEGAFLTTYPGMDAYPSNYITTQGQLAGTGDHYGTNNISVTNSVMNLRLFRGSDGKCVAAAPYPKLYWKPFTVSAGADVTIGPNQGFTRTGTDTAVANGSTITSRSWTITSGLGVGMTPSTNAALNWTPGSTTPNGDIRQPVYQEIAFELTSTAENSTKDWTKVYDFIADINDARGYTGGLIGFTVATTGMGTLLRYYNSIAPGNILAKYLPKFDQIEAAPYDQRAAMTHTLLDPTFVPDWKSAAQNDPLFRQAQRDERTRYTWLPALTEALADGVGPLGLAIHYDTMVNHGPGPQFDATGGILARARSRANPPSKGGNETTYLNAMVYARNEALEMWGTTNPNGRVPMHYALISSGNLSLTTPFSWTIYTDPFTISTPPPIPTDSLTGKYTLRYSATNSAGATATDDVTVTVAANGPAQPADPAPPSVHAVTLTQLYGKYEIRFKADAVAGWKFVPLLWPASDVWPRDGEIDFPEGDLTGKIGAFMHRQGATTGSDQDAFSTNAVFTDWHTATTEWTPNSCKFFLDGSLIGSVASRVPNTAMRWVIQAENSIGGTQPGNPGTANVQIDRIRVWSYTTSGGGIYSKTSSGVKPATIAIKG